MTLSRGASLTTSSLMARIWSPGRSLPMEGPSGQHTHTNTHIHDKQDSFSMWVKNKQITRYYYTPPFTHTHFLSLAFYLSLWNVHTHTSPPAEMERTITGCWLPAMKPKPWLGWRWIHTCRAEPGVSLPLSLPSWLSSNIAELADRKGDQTDTHTLFLQLNVAAFFW